MSQIFICLYLYLRPLQQCQVITEAYMQANPGLTQERALDLASLTVSAAYAFQVDPLLAAGVMITESHLKKNQISCCGALGYGQIRWCIWGRILQEYGIADCKEDLLADDQASIYASVYVLRHLLVRYHGDTERALAAYSGGAKNYSEKVKRIYKKGVIRF